jgi:hypothetical protein
VKGRRQRKKNRHRRKEDSKKERLQGTRKEKRQHCQLQARKGRQAEKVCDILKENDDIQERTTK